MYSKVAPSDFLCSVSQLVLIPIYVCQPPNIAVAIPSSLLWIYGLGHIHWDKGMSLSITKSFSVIHNRTAFSSIIKLQILWALFIVTNIKINTIVVVVIIKFNSF